VIAIGQWFSQYLVANAALMPYRGAWGDTPFWQGKT
jgi:hypothetical protein